MQLIRKDRGESLLILALSSILFWLALEGLALRSVLTLLPILFAVQIMLTDLVDAYLLKHTSTQTRWFKLFMAPGTILHELSHLFAALATGCIVTRVSLFKPNPKTGTLGYVQYQQPIDKWIVVRDIIIGFSPFFGCGLFLFLVNLLAGGGLLRYAFSLHVSQLDQIFFIHSDTASLLLVNIMSLDLSTMTGILLLYLQATFAFGASSSSTDLKNAFTSMYRHPIGMIFLLILLFLLLFLSEKPYGLLGFGDDIAGGIRIFLSLSLILVLVSQIILILSLPVLALSVQYLRIRGGERYVPPILAAATLLLLAYLGFYNPLWIMLVFLISSLMLANKKYFLK